MFKIPVPRAYVGTVPREPQALPRRAFLSVMPYTQPAHCSFDAAFTQDPGLVTSTAPSALPSVS